MKAKQALANQDVLDYLLWMQIDGQTQCNIDPQLLGRLDEDFLSCCQDVPTPCYLVSSRQLERNLKILSEIQDHSHCKILLALKAFSMFSTFDLVGKYLSGVCASGINEARLGDEFFHTDKFQLEVHAGAPAFSQNDFKQMVKICDHIVFNSLSQFSLHRKCLQQARNNGRNIKSGLRINPQFSQVETDLYDPCGKFSRMGITRDQLRPADLAGIDGLAMHCLCEQGADALANLWQQVRRDFGDLLCLDQIKWINLGGGHYITRRDYDRSALKKLLIEIRDEFAVDVYLEPGEAVALDCGVLVASVLDIIHNEMEIAILDCSAATQMPDVLEMPYRPAIENSGPPQKKDHTYRLAGPTCLAGDIIGDYSFDKPLKTGDRLIFRDMAHYTMVKNNTFNGMNLPAIALTDSAEKSFDIIRTFGYEDFRQRLS